MDRELKRWELALLLGLVLGLTAWAWFGNQRQELADRVIRLHVVANSDSAADQALKLAVRDEVLRLVEAACPPGADLTEVRRELEAQLPAITQAAQAVVEREGYSYPVAAALTESWFPTKQYDGFALPAGRYDALRVVVGQGEGENWWCVAYPPLCVGAASGRIEESAQAGGFSQDQTALITGDGEGYVLKFRILELLGQFQGR